MNNDIVEIIIVIIILIIITAICIIFYYQSIKSKDKSPPSEKTINLPGFGNVLAEYFGTIAWYFVHGRDAYIKINYVYTDIDPGTEPYGSIRRLPQFIPYDTEIAQQLLLIPDINNKVSDDFLRISDWSYNRGILRSMTPLIRKMRHYLDDGSICKSFINIKPPDVVIHFRCADAPRNRHPEYLFQRFKWYKFALEQASIRINKSYDDLSIIILSCTDFNLVDNDKDKIRDREKQNILCSSIVNI